ncbi:MAG: hypothetical protein KDC34_14225 [Saprospiraceae bacterium]|nr:hypothetical protein [Saprospiraceae bacterium]
MDSNFAILELKYGNIYGGYPNFFAISEVSVVIFEQPGNKIFIETWRNRLDVDYVSVSSKTNELGHTTGRIKEVINMRTGRTRPFVEEFQLDDRDLQYNFKILRPVQSWIRKFLLNTFRKYNVRNILTFDGRRDIFLCERSGIDFRNSSILDLQRELNRETDYLFSLNKLGVVIGFDMDGSYLRSNNLEYWLHPIAAKQLIPKTAAWDAARLLMVHNEYREYHDDFMMKAALLLNKIQSQKEG